MSHGGRGRRPRPRFKTVELVLLEEKRSGICLPNSGIGYQLLRVNSVVSSCIYILAMRN